MLIDMVVIPIVSSVLLWRTFHALTLSHFPCNPETEQFGGDASYSCLRIQPQSSFIRNTFFRS